ncbi:MAG: outer rane receptor protein [Gammaproteobacteria bacterium]|jgi:iron complex outermembrane receptor protein|nr:outer rane receptor protein [Gammaproteobacteria bacterium]
MRVSRTVWRSSVPAAVILGCLGGPAAADTTGPLEEIVVTAQKRTESLSQVPAAVSVVSGEDLRTAGIGNAESLQQMVPTLTFKKGTSNLNSTLSIRGIGTQSFASGAEPSVATVVDGVVMGRAGMAFTEFTDIAQIEVLQGPQGTLFGKNASAGVVNMTTRGPTPELEGEGSVSYFDHNEYKASVRVGGPITAKIGFSLAAVYGDYAGNVKNVFDDTWTNGYRRTGIRGKLVAELTDSLKLTLGADYVHANDKCCADVLGTYLPSAAYTGVFRPSISPVVPGATNMKIDNDLAPSTIDTNAGTSAQLDWSRGGYTITSISAFRRWYNYQQRDGDFHASFANYVIALDLLQHDHGALTFKQYSEELRLASPEHQFLTYVVGGFIWHTDERDWFTRDDNQCTASTLPVDATGFKPCTPGASTYLVTRGFANWDTKFDNASVFGQGTANLTDRFRLIGGARFTHDKVSYTFARVDLPVAGPGVGAPYAGNGSTSHDGWSAKAGGQFDLTDNMVGYATWSRGYKGPAFNVFFNMSALNTAPIAPETSDAYEIGLKSNFFDHHLRLNLAAYRETFDNFQTNSFVLINGSVTTSLTNAGQVRSQGFTADLEWHPFSGFGIVGGYAYDDATIVSYLCAGQTGAALTTCRSVHDGAQLPFAPRNKFNLTPSWLLPTGSSLPFTTRLVVSYVYTSALNFDIDQTPLARQRGYGLLSAAIVFADPADKYELSVMGKNLTDKFYTDFITPVGNGVAAGAYARLQIPRDAERYFGVSLTAKF